MSYRILSLDGGGTWALIQIKALIALYNNDTSTLGQTVLEDFDLVAASSGGSIVLGALVENLTLGEILAFFQDEAKRKAIFSKSDSLGDRVLHDLTGLGPKYSAENKLPALQHVLPAKGNVPLDQVAIGLRRTGAAVDLHLLIVAFDYDRNRATFFRSSPTGGPSWGAGETSDVTLAEALHATTNAPVNYFDAPATFPDHPGRYWDGAITGCNNPVLAAVTEAIAKEQEPSEIVALSIGTASVALPWPQPEQLPSPYLQQVVDPGIVTDLRKLATSILDDPPDIATYLAHVMTGSGIGLNKPPAESRVVRMNPLISPQETTGGWAAPGPMTAAQFTYLAKLDMDAVEQPQVDAISKYADLWLHNLVLNQPIRMNGDTLDPELGQNTFTTAEAAWNAIK
jgi:uncharacterized protein